MLEVINSKEVTIPTMTTQSIEAVRALETEALKLTQVQIPVNHVLHAGMYARTVMIPAGVMITGALIKVATALIVSGDATVYVGAKTIRLTGYNVMSSGAMRKQAFLAHADTHLTMIFPSSASTVEEAEDEFTDEAELLSSRRESICPV